MPSRLPPRLRRLASLTLRGERDSTRFFRGSLLTTLTSLPRSLTPGGLAPDSRVVHPSHLLQAVGVVDVIVQGYKALAEQADCVPTQTVLGPVPCAEYSDSGSDGAELAASYGVSYEAPVRVSEEAASAAVVDGQVFGLFELGD